MYYFCKLVSKQSKTLRHMALSISFRKFTSPSGYTVLIGSNARENHILSTKVIKGTDMWFHAEEFAGAHVLMQLSKKDNPTLQDIVFCNYLALEHSKGRHDKTNAVISAFGTDVVYQKGDPIGTMTLVNI